MLTNSAIYLLKGHGEDFWLAHSQGDKACRGEGVEERGFWERCGDVRVGVYVQGGVEVRCRCRGIRDESWAINQLYLCCSERGQEGRC